MLNCKHTEEKKAGEELLNFPLLRYEVLQTTLAGVNKFSGDEE